VYVGAVGKVLVGCSGWQYKDWRGVVYPPRCPQRDWLEVYAREFKTVEVNATFYRLPNRDAVARWAEQVPEGFVFTVKVSRYLTHMKRLTTVADGMVRLNERIEPIVERGCLGPLLWQLPPQFKRNDERLASALGELPDGRHAFEFRDTSWFHDDVYALLREHGVATVLAHDARRPLPEPPPTADFAFVRFHWGERGRRGNYSDAELERWAPRIHAMAQGRDAFVYFNNDWEGFAPRNAVLLERLLER
jgi:uncharacterized protein YecE (DUF72 family)